MPEKKDFTRLVANQIVEAQARAERILQDVAHINDILLRSEPGSESEKTTREQPVGWFELTKDSLDTILGTLHAGIMEIKRLAEVVGVEKRATGK